MAQAGVVTTGEHSADPPSLARQRWMARGEDAAMHAVQPADPHAVIDRAAAEAGVDELPPADDAVLPRGELGDSEIRTGRVGLFMHHMNKATGR